MARPGPHQVAQKSTSTGLSDFKTSWSKFASVTSTIPLPAIFFLLVVNVALSARRSIGRRCRACDRYKCVPVMGVEPTIVTPSLDAWGGGKVAKGGCRPRTFARSGIVHTRGSIFRRWEFGGRIPSDSDLAHLDAKGGISAWRGPK